MNSETFVKYLTNPAKLYQLPYEELKTLALQYPWCQNLRLLLLKKSKQDNHEEYERNLHLAALYSVDRTHLYQQLKDSQLVDADSADSFLLQEEFLELKNLQEIDTEAHGELIKVEPPNTEEVLPLTQKTIEPETISLEPLDFSTLNDDTIEELEEETSNDLISEILAAGAAGMAAESLIEEEPTFAQEQVIQGASEDREEEIDLDLDELLEPVGEVPADSPKEDLISNLNLEEWLEPDSASGQVNLAEPEAGSEPQIIDVEQPLEDLEDVQEDTNSHFAGEIASAGNDVLDEGVVDAADPLLASIDEILGEEIVGNAASTENTNFIDGLKLSEEEELLNDVGDLLGYDEEGSAASEEQFDLPPVDMSKKDNLAKVLEEEEEEYNDGLEEVEEIIAEAASASFTPRDKIDQEMTSLLDDFDKSMPSVEPILEEEKEAILEELEVELPGEPVLEKGAILEELEVELPAEPVLEKGAILEELEVELPAEPVLEKGAILEELEVESLIEPVLEEEVVPVMEAPMPVEVKTTEPIVADDFFANIDDLLEETPMDTNDELEADDLLENIEEDFVRVVPTNIPFEVVDTTLEEEEDLEDSFPVIDTAAFKARVEESREEIAKQEEELRAKAAKKAKKKEKKKKKKKKKKNSEAARIAKQSLQEDEEIGSELLAEILVMQGNDEKAIEMYQRLSLANPEKSAYFAAKIKELEEDDDDDDDL